MLDEKILTMTTPSQSRCPPAAAPPPPSPVVPQLILQPQPTALRSPRMVSEPPSRRLRPVEMGPKFVLADGVPPNGIFVGRGDDQYNNFILPSALAIWFG